ncbi:MAG: cupin domain-containing protein [Actinomycetota bacterium]|nr:cupin domain-containing protein [Actinomycetota bacterium]
MQIFDARGADDPEKMLVHMEGAAYGAGVSIIFEDTDKDGDGPYLHMHPYPETFVIRVGKALFTVGGEEQIEEAGMVLVVPKLTPHKFAVIGPDRFVSTNIHASDTFITEWLEGPRSAAG